MKSPTPLWLFDLDNTLHDASHAILPAIHDNMNAFLAQTLGSDGQSASAELVNHTRNLYWKRYGATLLGMMKHHDVKPAAFLEAAHRFTDLPAMLRFERGLARLLKRLPGKKILLTNAPYRYSRDVLCHLGLHQHFARHIAIESMWVHRQLRPKPSKALLRKLLARHKVPARRCILVEDTCSALKSAKSLGMRTVWITQYLSGTGQLSPRLQQQRMQGLAATETGRDMPAQAPGTNRPGPHRRSCASAPRVRGVQAVDVQLKSVRQLPRHLSRLTA